MKVSIIMAAYNSGSYISEAIKSVLEQTYMDWELIIINDGSTDKTCEIVSSIQDNRIILHSQENQGVSSARNYGLREMKGSLFCFLDADDKLTPNSLESRVRLFKQNENVTFLDGKVMGINVSGKEEKPLWEPNFAGEVFYQLMSNAQDCFFGPTWLIKKMPHKVFFDEAMTHAEDLQFYLDYARNGGIYGFVDEAVFMYRQGNESAMKNLQGLEDGYLHLYKNICQYEEVTRAIKRKFKQNLRSMMFKSYLGKFKLAKALKLYLRPWE